MLHIEVTLASSFLQHLLQQDLGIKQNDHFHINKVNE